MASSSSSDPNAEYPSTLLVQELALHRSSQDGKARLLGHSTRMASNGAGSKRKHQSLRVRVELKGSQAPAPLTCVRGSLTGLCSPASHW